MIKSLKTYFHLKIISIALCIILLSLFHTLDSFAVTAPSNPLILLDDPMATQPITDGLVFEFSKTFTPGYSINQNDQSLNDLFNSNKVSKLCGPTSLAEALVFLYKDHNSPLSQLLLAGINPDNKSIDSNSLVRSLAELCNTNPESGTTTLNLYLCSMNLFSQSGYSTNSIKVISPDINLNSPGVIHRSVTLKDIRDALDKGNPVILEAGWYEYDTLNKIWIRKSGHFIGVYGYDYNSSWNEQVMQIKVIDPETDYNSTTPNGKARFTTLTLSQISPQLGVSYPSNRSYVLSGSGFGGAVKRGFLGELILLGLQ